MFQLLNNASLFILCGLAFLIYLPLAQATDATDTPTRVAVLPVKLDKMSSHTAIGKHFVMIEDVHSIYDINQMFTPQLRKKFKPSQQEVLNFGFTSSTYWAKLNLQSTEKINNKWFLEIAYPLLDKVSVYVIDEHSSTTPKVIKQWHVGDTVEFAKRPVSQVNFVFPIEFEPQQHLTVLVKVANSGPLTAPVNLYSERRYDQHSANFQLYSGFFYGMMLAMIFYNLFIFMATKDNSYFFYVNSISAQFAFAFVMYGHANQYWFAQHPQLTYYAPSVFMCITCITAVMFCQRFLQLKEFMPRCNLILNGIIIFVVSLLLLLFLFSPENLVLGMTSTTIFALPMLSIAVIIRMRDGFHPAQYLLWRGLCQL